MGSARLRACRDWRLAKHPRIHIISVPNSAGKLETENVAETAPNARETRTFPIFNCEPTGFVLSLLLLFGFLFAVQQTSYVDVRSRYHVSGWGWGSRRGIQFSLLNTAIAKRDIRITLRIRSPRAPSDALQKVNPENPPPAGQNNSPRAGLAPTNSLHLRWRSDHLDF
jgi:hypothetical protein